MKQQDMTRRCYATRLLASLASVLVGVVTFADTQVVDGITWHYQLNWSGTEASLGVGHWDCDDDSSWYVLEESAVSEDLTGAISIPTTLGGCPVKTIGEEAFSGCVKLNEVTIPSSVSRIEERAFAGCTGLNYIVFEGAPPYAFYPDDPYWFYDLSFSRVTATGIYRTDKSAWDAVIVDGKWCGLDMAYACSGYVVTFDIGSYGKRVGGGALVQNVTSGTSAVAPEIDVDPSYRFIRWDIDYSNVRGNLKVTAVYERRTIVAGGITYYYSLVDGGAQLDGVASASGTVSSLPTEADGYAIVSFKRGLFKGSSITTVNLNDSRLSEMGYLFTGCTKLATVTLGNNVKALPGSMFSGCSSLSSVSLSQGLGAMGDRAFLDCTSLKEITIPEGVTNVGQYAFSGCTALATIHWPSTITRVGEGAFRSCTSVSKLYLADVKSYCNADYETDCRSQEEDDYYDSTPLYCAKPTTLYLNGQVVTDLVIPEGTVNIPHHAFYNLTTIQSVSFPSTIKSSSDGAFWGWTSIKRVYVADLNAWLKIDAHGQLTYDGGYCYCWLPTQMHTSPTLYVNGEIADTVVVPQDIRYLSDCALAFGNLKHVDLSTNMTYLGTALSYSGIENLDVHEGVTEIEYHAFTECKNLKYVSLPSTLDTVGEVFQACPNLRRVEFNCSGVKLSRYAFSGYYYSSGTTTNLESMVFHGDAPMIFTYDYYDNMEESQLTSFTSKAVVYADEGSSGWECDIPGTWQGHTIKYLSTVKLSDCKMGGAADWVEDLGAFKSGVISANQSSMLTYKVSGPGTFSFDWKVSSESGCDTLSVSLDGNAIAGLSAISGECKWTSASFVIDSTGDHEITWKYSKDGSVNKGSDCGWVRDFVMKALATITLKFDSNGGSQISDLTMYSGMTAGDLPKPTRAGYTFAGWHSTLLDKVVGSSTVLNESETLTATWTANSYTITFNPGSGTVSEKSRIVTYDAKFKTLPVPVRSGYFFAGWYDGNGNHITGDAICKMTSSQTLTARWLESVSSNNQYGDGCWRDGGSGYWDRALEIKVTGTGQLTYGYYFHNGGASFNVYVDDVLYESLNSTSYTAINKTVNILSSGSHIIKFEMEVDDYGDDYGYGEVVVSGLKYTSRTFSTHNIYFKANGGACDQSYKTVAAGFEYRALPTPTRQGAYFDGWYTDASGGTKVQSDSIVQECSYEYLYAHWWFVDYQISYQNLRGASNPNPRSYTVVDSFDFQPLAHAADRYFLGWSLEGISEGTMGDWYTPITVKARWLLLNDSVRIDENGRCSIQYSVDSDATIPGCSASLYYVIKGITNIAQTVTGDMTLSVGIHELTWDMAVDCGKVFGPLQIGIAIRREAGTAQVSRQTVTPAANAWSRDSNTKYSNEYAWKSAAIDDSEHSDLIEKVSGVGKVSFVWKTSSEQRWDALSFLVDGQQLSSVSGICGFANQTFQLDGGEHTLTWRYEKDGGDYDGYDCGWVACITYEAANMSDLKLDIPLGEVGLDVADVLGEGMWSISDPMFVGGGHDSTSACGASVGLTSAVGTNQWLQLEIDGPGRIDFDWKVSSLVLNGAIINGLSCSVDGVLKATIGGARDWSKASYAVVGNGSHVVSWSFNTRGSLPQMGYDDWGWVSNVGFHPLVTVSFGGNSGEIGDFPEPKSAYDDEQIILPDASGFSLPYHRFVGWTDGTNMYSAGSSYSASNGVRSFTAVWELCKLAMPTIIAATPYAAESVSVEIGSTDNDVELYYSLDGGSYFRYVDVLTVSGDHVIKAFSKRTNCIDSDVAELTVSKCRYSVRFMVGSLGQIESGNAEQDVAYGDSATPPVISMLSDWYYFDGWDHEYAYITSNTVVNATYRKRPYSITFLKSGEESGVDVGSLDYYIDEPILVPECTYVLPCHSFAGWRYGECVYQPGESLVYDGKSTSCTATWLEKRLSAPTISPTEYDGEYTPVTITSSDSEASIYYTLDGTIPDKTTSIRYEGSLMVTGTTVVTAIAIKDDWFDSAASRVTVMRGPWTFGEYLNSPNLQFSTSGDKDWLRAREARGEVGYYLTSGHLNDSQTNAIETVIVGAGTIRFRFAASTESWPGVLDFDYFKFYVDGVAVSAWSGETGWQEYEYSIFGNGPHTMRWAYEKDSGHDLELSFDNCVWLDNVTWVSADPIPELGDKATQQEIIAALDGSADARLKSCITNIANYNAYRDWSANVKTADGAEKALPQAVKDSPNAWLSFALHTDKLIGIAPKDGDLKVNEFTPTSNAGTYEMTVELVGIEVGAAATAENLKRVFGLEGSSSLDADSFSPDNVGIEFGTPIGGKVKCTVVPKDKTAGAFFMKVKMNP